MDRPFSHDRFPKLSDTIRSVVEGKTTPTGKVLKAAKRSVLADRDGRDTPKAQGAMAKYRQALKAANAADLKEYPGKRGEAAHKRLHKTIGAFLKGKSVKESLDAVNARHGGALERMDEAALKASSDTLRKKYDRHEGDVISHMDYSGRTPGSYIDTPKTRLRMGRKHTAMALIKREMDRRGERVGYQFEPMSQSMKAGLEKREQEKRAEAEHHRKFVESNPHYARNVERMKKLKAQYDERQRKAREARGG